ncbi:MAG: transcriptional regulator [Thermoplasmata archaeon]|nr:transcriptional regulator [Thermoplasmata archaeon]MCI4354162.1 transcriptional regulator [Thermoplasmata archaeon]
MPVLFRREVPLRSIVAIQARQARALQAPIRLAMLDLLAQRPMSVEGLSEELPAHGFRKASNTLRHHLEILVSSGLVELAVLEQTRGAVLKYFAASARPLHFALPDESEADLNALADHLHGVVGAAMRDLARTEAPRVGRLAASLKKCPRCSQEHYEEYVLLMALHRACITYLRSRPKAKPARSAAARPKASVPRARAG